MVILIAEDEAMVAFALEWALTAAGHEIVGPVCTTVEALEAVRAQKPDLALVNLVLQGGESGANLALELLVRHETPTILVTADIQGARACKNVAQGLIKKPYDAETIPSVVWYLDEL